jgi:hypothetical protein
MSLLDYQSARPWAKSIREAVLSRKMPPWFADASIGHFANDPRLSAEELATIKAWVDSGAPEGKAEDLPPKPTFNDGWQLGQPDIVFDIGEDFTVPPGNDVYQYFTVPTNFTEGKWIRAAQILPGNRQIVHHVHVSVVVDKKETAPEKTSAFRPQTGDFWEVRDGLSRLKMDAPVVDDACASEPPGLQALSGFEEGSFTAMLPGKPAEVMKTVAVAEAHRVGGVREPHIGSDAARIVRRRPCWRSRLVRRRSAADAPAECRGRSAAVHRACAQWSWPLH